jgi:hypothetical protein
MIDIAALAVEHQHHRVGAHGGRTPVARARSHQGQRLQKGGGKVAIGRQDTPRNVGVHSLLGYSPRKQTTPDLPKTFEQYNIALKLNPRDTRARTSTSARLIWWTKTGPWPKNL